MMASADLFRFASSGMIEHTHNLNQYGVVIGRKVYMYKRPKTKRAGYVHPVPAGVESFRSKADAVEFKQWYDAT